MNTLANSGSWCWFSYPRARRYKGQRDQTFFGYVTSAGNIVIQSYDHDAKSTEKFTLGKYEVDDHNNPSINVFGNGELFVSYSRHNKDRLIRYRKSATGNITGLGEEKTLESPRGVISYSQVHIFDNTVLMLYRVAPREPRDKPRYWVLRTSKDRGETWSGEKLLFDFGTGEQGYIVSSQRLDYPQTVDIVISGHPAHGEQHDVKYCYVRLDSGKINIPEGTTLGNIYTDPNESIPLTDLFTVYDYKENNNVRAWIWDVHTVGDDPRILFTTYPDGKHKYHYACYNRSKKKFDIREILTTPCGIADEREIYYSGGMGFLKKGDSLDRLYLSTKVHDRWEIQKWITSNKGKTWLNLPITAHSHLNNYRPIPIINYHNEMEVLWMSGDYTFYMEYNTEIKY